MAFNLGALAGGAGQGLNTTLRAFQDVESIKDAREKREERKREAARKEALFGDVKNLYGEFDKRRQGDEFDPVKDVEDLASNLTLTRAKHGFATPEELTQLGDRYKKAQTEGITDAMQLLAAGKDAEALEVFQKRGNLRMDDPAAVKITRQNRTIGGMAVPDVVIEGTSGGKPFKLSRWDMLMQTMPPDKVAGMAKNVAGADYYRSSRRGTQSADMQWIDHLTKNLGMTPRAATQFLVDYRKMATVNPAESRRKLYEKMREARDKKFLEPGDPGFVSDDELWQMAGTMITDASGDRLDLTRDFPVNRSSGAIGAPPAARGLDPNAFGPPQAMPRPDVPLRPAQGTPPSQPAQQPPAQQPAQPQPGAATPAAQDAPPPQAFAGLKEGMERKFRNGQVWTIKNGKPVRVR